VELTEQMSGKTVLVTGASGFIGAHLCQRLSASGAVVHAVSRSLHHLNSDNLRWWHADLKDMSAVRQVVEAVQPQIVFHLASYVVGARRTDVVLPTFYDNLASTVHLLTASTEAGCRRIILASSSEEPQNVSDATFPCSPYAAAKWASSMYGRMFYQLFEAPIVMPRIFMTYGPDQKDTQKLVPFVILQLLRGEAPKLSSGRRLADWIYIEDVVEGLIRAAFIPGIEGCAFDLGSGFLMSVREIVEQIVEIMGSGIKPAFDALPDRPFEQERAANTEFLLNKLKYQPGTSVRKGLEATIAWYCGRFGATCDGSPRSENISYMNPAPSHF
jgi:nucleoside-diphosphate-sugar epimerase